MSPATKSTNVVVVMHRRQTTRAGIRSIHVECAFLRHDSSFYFQLLLSVRPTPDSPPCFLSFTPPSLVAESQSFCHCRRHECHHLRHSPPPSKRLPAHLLPQATTTCARCFLHNDLRRIAKIRTTTTCHTTTGRPSIHPSQHGCQRLLPHLLLQRSHALQPIQRVLRQPNERLAPSSSASQVIIPFAATLSLTSLSRLEFAA